MGLIRFFDGCVYVTCAEVFEAPKLGATKAIEVTLKSMKHRMNDGTLAMAY